MSASLVGSEMCIRDRDSNAQLAAWAPLPTWLRERSIEALERPPEGRGSVSYTHLTLPTICSV
eukprot:12130294-Alexandrium_andersonii.AAC.1